MLTIREQILQLIHNQLLTITLANGYHTDVGTRVFRGRNEAMPDEVPCTFLYAYGDENPSKSSPTFLISSRTLVSVPDPTLITNPLTFGAVAAATIALITSSTYT